MAYFIFQEKLYFKKQYLFLSFPNLNNYIKIFIEYISVFKN